MHGVDFTDEPIKRGPITYRHNGKGFRPWLPEVTYEPGWVYLVSSPMGDGQRRMCWRCVPALQEQHEGRARVFWDEAPPAADDRCPRCERSYGERPN